MDHYELNRTLGAEWREELRADAAPEVFYIDPNQFAGGTDEDERAAFDDEVDELIQGEAEARDIAQRLADFLEYPVLVQSRREEGTRIIFEPAFTIQPTKTREA
jgi:hypothetical protein